MVGKLTNQLRSLFRSKTPSDAQSAQAAAGIPVAIPSPTAAVSTGDAPSVSESGAIHLNSSLLEVEPSGIPPIPVPNATASAPPSSPPAAASPGPTSEWDDVLARARARIPNKRS